MGVILLWNAKHRNRTKHKKPVSERENRIVDGQGTTVIRFSA